MSEHVETSAQQMLRVLRAGGLAMACTDTGYGFVGMRTDAIRRIYALKGRAESKQCVTVGTLAIADQLAVDLSPARRAWLADAALRWPLAIILRYRRDAALFAKMEPYVAQQTRRGDTTALFFGVGAVIRRCAELAYADGELVFGSSANVSGTGNHYDLATIPSELRYGVDLLVTGTPRFYSSQRLASTIVDFTTGAITRRGVEAAAVEQAWRSLPEREDVELVRDVTAVALG